MDEGKKLVGVVAVIALGVALGVYAIQVGSPDNDPPLEEQVLEMQETIEHQASDIQELRSRVDALENQ